MSQVSTGAAVVPFPTPGPERFVVRELDETDTPAILALHRQGLESAPTGLLNPETDAFFAQHLGPVGRIYGAVAPDGALIAYGVLGLPTADSPYNFGRDFGLAEPDLSLVAHLDGAVVAASWRGLGLQRVLTQRRLAVVRASGRRHVLATVAPLNIHSLHNCLAVGLRVRMLKRMFAARHWRFLVYHDLAGDPPLDDRSVRRVVLGDHDGLLAAIAAGGQGFALSDDRDQAALLFAAPVNGGAP